MKPPASASASAPGRRSSSIKGKGLALGKAFFGRSKPEEVEIVRCPRQGDLLRLDGFGKEMLMNDGQRVTLQTLLDISVSGVVIFTFPSGSSSKFPKQMSAFYEAHSELTNSGFGLYGLTRDSTLVGERPGEKHGLLSMQWLCDQSGTIITALGLEKTTSGDLVRGVVVIAKDGRVLVSNAGTSDATLEAVAPLIRTLDTLERTPAQEYTGEEYFARSPLTPSSPVSASDYFPMTSPVNASTATLHSYLQFMDNQTPKTPRHSVSEIPASPPSTHRTSVGGRRPLLPPRMHTWHAQGSRSPNSEVCPACGTELLEDGKCACDTQLGSENGQRTRSLLRPREMGRIEGENSQ